MGFYFHTCYSVKSHYYGKRINYKLVIKSGIWRRECSFILVGVAGNGVVLGVSVSVVSFLVIVHSFPEHVGHTDQDYLLNSHAGLSYQALVVTNNKALPEGIQ